MTGYPFLLDEFLDEYDLTREQFAEIIGKDVSKLTRIERRGGLTSRENSLLCQHFGRDAVAEYYDMRPNISCVFQVKRNMQEKLNICHLCKGYFDI